MSLSDLILSFAGLARKRDIENLQGNISRLELKNENNRQVIQDAQELLVSKKEELSHVNTQLNILRDEKNLLMRQQDWCGGIALDFPPGTPRELHQRTISFVKYFLRSDFTSFNDLLKASNFSAEEQWALYWCLTYAADAALKDAGRKVEDGITDTFIHHLTSQVQQAKLKLSATALPLQLAYCCIYEQCQPAMKEADVGADVLLIIAGAGLVADGGARLFWIQAKKPRSDPFDLDCGYRNKKGLQFDALMNVNEPQRGSFSLYMQYAIDLPYIASFWLGQKVRPTEKNSIDLKLHGIRCQELISALSAVKANNIGIFSNEKEIIDFLKLKSESKPLHVVIAADGSAKGVQRWPSKSMLENIVDYYEKEFGLKLAPEKNQEKDWGMDM